jgi:hypothetical protein
MTRRKRYFIHFYISFRFPLLNPFVGTKEGSCGDECEEGVEVGGDDDDGVEEGTLKVRAEGCRLQTAGGAGGGRAGAEGVALRWSLTLY